MSKELSTKHKWIIAIAILLSIIAITLSIVSICKTYPTQNQGLDYWGLILGVLALLITILVGWQIFSIINFQSAQKEIQDAKTSFQKAEEEIRNSHNEIEVLHKEAEELKEEAKTFYNDNQKELHLLAAKIHATTAIVTNDRFDTGFTSYKINICEAIKYFCKVHYTGSANSLLEDVLETVEIAPTEKHKFLLIKGIEYSLRLDLKQLDSVLVQRFIDLYNEIPLKERDEYNSRQPTK